MRILVLIEMIDGIVSEPSLGMISFAIKLGGSVEALICADEPTLIEAARAQLSGVHRVIGIIDAGHGEYLPTLCVSALNTAISQCHPDLVLVSYSTAGIDVAAGASIHNSSNVICYVTDIAMSGDSLLATSQLYGGKVMAETTVPLPAIAVIMPAPPRVDVKNPQTIPPVEFLKRTSPDTCKGRVIEKLTMEGGGTDLTKVDRIVCVGRALGGTDKLPIVEAFAAKMHAEIAGSRPVIDAGWLPKFRQVGKSGTKVKPKLYFAVGISGAPEHLEGMQDSDLIIALNIDAKAPIFSRAHYGAVCDMFHVLPALTALL